MKRVWRGYLCVVLIIVLAMALAACHEEQAPNAGAPDNDALYEAAVRDAVFAQEDEILPLVNVTHQDERVIWHDDKVLVLFMHKYPDSYPAGEDIQLRWGNVWCVSAGEAYRWVQANEQGVTDWTLRLH
ncbi:MAG: hypothetical protein J5755_04960, partial [Clostridia bacterium]|nr:hypothetical protein [Clostridia bacterium]